MFNVYCIMSNVWNGSQLNVRRIAGEGSDPKTNVCLPTYLEENV